LENLEGAMISLTFAIAAVSLLLETARKGLKTRRRRGSHNEVVEGVLLQAFIMFLETR
jgi:hypothetical protein